MHRLSFGLIIATIGVANPAAAQAPTADEAIIVTAETLKKAREESHAYIRELGVARGNEQAARWLTPICPKVVGIAEPQAAEAQRRMRDIVKNVRAPLAPEKCKANLVVVLTGDPKKFVELVAKKDASKLARTPRRADREFLFGNAPARWWYDLGLQNRDSTPAASDAGPQVVAEADNPGGGHAAQSKSEMPGSADTAYSNQYSASRLATPTIRAIRAATVVVNFADVSRFGLGAAVDYAALVGLAEVRPGAFVDGSILSLFNPGSVRRELSNRDIAFLTGLYLIPLDREALVQRTTLVNIMTNGTGALTGKQ